MRIEDALRHFSNFDYTEYDYDSRLREIGDYSAFISNKASKSKFCWTLSDTPRVLFADCARAILHVVNSKSAARRWHPYVLRVFQTVANIAAKPSSSLPICAVFECDCAWDLASMMYQGKWRAQIEDYFENSMGNVRRRYAELLRSRVQELETAVNESDFRLGCDAIEEIEFNLDICPVALFPDDLHPTITLLKQCVAASERLGEKASLTLDEYTAICRAYLRNTSQTVVPTSSIVRSNLWNSMFRRPVADFQKTSTLLRVMEHASALATFVEGAPQSKWHISMDDAVDRFFAVSSLAEFVAFSDRVDITTRFVTIREQTRILLEPINKSTADAVDSCLVLHVADPLFRDNSLHLKTLLHFFYGHLMAGAEAGNVELAMQLFLDNTQKLDDVIKAHGHCSVSFCRNLGLALTSVGLVSASIRVGNAYHYYHALSDGDSEQNADRLVERVRLFSSRPHDGLLEWCCGSSPLNNLCIEVAEYLNRLLGDSDYAYRHFVEFGFIVPQNQSVASQGAAKTNLPKTAPAPTAKELTERQKRLMLLAAASAAFDENPEPADHHEAHDYLVKLENWDVIRQAMDYEADDINGEIRKNGRLTKTLARRLTKRALECPEVVRRGIARRAVMPWALLCKNEAETGQKLGFGTDIKAQTKEQREKRRKAIQNFEKYLKEWQLKDMNFANPESSVSLTPDEKDYVSSHPE